MKITFKVCIAIMLTIILGVNVIAFASYENKIVDSNVNIIEENNNEFEYTGVPSGKIVTASQLKEDRMRSIVTTTIIAVTLALIFYFFVKIIMFIIANKKYKKALPKRVLRSTSGEFSMQGDIEHENPAFGSFYL